MTDVKSSSEALKQMRKDLIAATNIFELAECISFHMGEANARMFDVIESEDADALFLISCEYSFIHAIAAKILEYVADGSVYAKPEGMLGYKNELIDQIEKAQLHFQQFDSNNNPINENIH